MEGPGFFALHTAFQTQYEELFVAIDEIAERIRALDAFAIGGVGTLAKAAQIKELTSPLAQEEYVGALIAANEKVVSDAAEARDIAGEAGDAESQDVMIGRITPELASARTKSFPNWVPGAWARCTRPRYPAGPHRRPQSHHDVDGG